MIPFFQWKHNNIICDDAKSICYAEAMQEVSDIDAHLNHDVKN
jgi:hypothetical protein